MRRRGMQVHTILRAISVCALLIVSLPVIDSLISPEICGGGSSVAFAQDDPCAGCDTVRAEIEQLRAGLANPPSDAASSYLMNTRNALNKAEARLQQCVDNGCMAALVAAQQQQPSSSGDSDGGQDSEDLQAPDSDGDGVPDVVDDCPGTPAKVAVDSRGCPKEMALDVSMPEHNEVFAPETVNMTVEGHVRNLQGGYPMGGVTIRTYLYDQGSEDVEWDLELDPTDSDGYFLGPFQLTEIPAGIYSLRVTASAQGYADVSETINGITIGEVVVACTSDSDCDDGNPCTIDTCINPGTPSAACSHQPITSCIDDDGCCPSGCDYTTDNDCARPANIEALNVLHDATQSAIDAVKERIHDRDDSPTDSEEFEEELRRIDQGIEELNLGIEALDEQIEDLTQQLLIEELRTKNEQLEMQLRVAKEMNDLLFAVHAVQVVELAIKEGIIKTKDTEMAAMQLSIADDALLMMVGTDTECEIEELREDGLLARVKNGVVGWLKYSKDALVAVAGAASSVADIALAPLDYINPFTVSVFSENAGLFSTHTKFEFSYDPVSRIMTVTVFEDSVTVTSLLTDAPEIVISAGQRIEVTDDGFSPTLDLSQEDMLSLADRYAAALGGANPLLIAADTGPESANRAPTASFALMPQDPTTDDTIVGVSTSSDPDGDELIHSWYFDGEYDANIGNLPEWTWPNPPEGEYTIGLVVMDGAGGVDETSTTVTVVGDGGADAGGDSGGMNNLLFLLLIPVAVAVVVVAGRMRRRR